MPDRSDPRYVIFDFPDKPGQSSNPAIQFHSVFSFPGWEMGPEWIMGIIQRYGCKDILEIGSGANSSLSAQAVAALGVRYTVNDVDPKELEKADQIFERWVGNLAHESGPPEMQNRYDLIFSRMVNEHVSDGRAYHANIVGMLKPGGIAAHCFSTLYCFPFLVNWLMPDFVSGILLNIFMPRDSHKLGKFKAYYDWSRGPSGKMIRRFEELGYRVLQYHGYFGHAYYFRVPVVQWLESIKARLLLRKPVAALTSYGMLIAQKR